MKHARYDADDDDADDDEESDPRRLTSIRFYCLFLTVCVFNE